MPIVYKKGGTFEPEPGKKGKNTEAATTRRIEWRFKVTSKCRCVFLVSVFHIRKDGKKVTLKEGLRPDPPFEPPHGGFHVNEYAVDTPRRQPQENKNGHKPPITCVGYLQQERKGDIVTGHDQPRFAKQGYTEVFETAAICFDRESDGRYVVLRSMKWEINGALKIIKKRGKIDRGKPSAKFVKAVEDWISRFGNDCRCRCLKETEAREAAEKEAKKEKGDGKSEKKKSEKKKKGK